MSAPAFVDRRGSDSHKWRRYPPDVIPLWVADMDVAADPAILAALHARIDEGCLGYGRATEAQRGALVDALWRDHRWRVEPDWLVMLPGVEPGFNMALRAFGRPGRGVLQELPVYAPLRAAPARWGLEAIEVWQRPGASGRWESDEAALEAGAARASVLLLCNPQNPTGRMYDAEELARRAALCERHDLTLVSDEIHGGLALDGRAHVPVASLGEGIAARSVTLMAASKTWNVAGLKAAFAVVPDPARRAAFEAARMGMVDSVGVLGLAGMAAAYGATAWRDAARLRLAATRDRLLERLARDLPRARVLAPEAGFLAWIDFSACALPGPAAAVLLEHARVALSPGADFGSGLEGWARLNYGCAAPLLEEAVDRIAAVAGGGGEAG